MFFENLGFFVEQGLESISGKEKCFSHINSYRREFPFLGVDFISLPVVSFRLQVGVVCKLDV